MNIATTPYIAEILFLRHLIETASRFAPEIPGDTADSASVIAVEQRRMTLAKILATAQLDLDQATFWLYESFNYTGLAPTQLLKRMKAIHEAASYVELCHRSVRQAMLISTGVAAPYKL